jgi:hypothetical protein
VTAFGLDLTHYPESDFEIAVNGTKLEQHANTQSIFRRTGNTWALGETFIPMTKSPGLQGPIDDAFMSSFVFVAPSGRALHEDIGQFIKQEFERAVFEWRAQFRGAVQVVKDSDAEKYLQESNLILWGDPQSNAMLRKLLPRLPLEWTADHVKLGKVSLDARKHVPLMIFPNPLNPRKYVVLNSGFTFREFGSNADQTPKLPDYALLDIAAPDPFKTGIKAAGFFDEQWRFDPARVWP